MSFDVVPVRARFPALATGTAHFDSPGGSQTPEPVARAVHDTLVSPIANQGSVTAAERTAQAVVTGARAAVADLVGGDPRGVVFGRSMTQLTFDMARTLSRTWAAGDEVVVSRLDHDANVRPWTTWADRTGAALRWVDFDTGSAELTIEHVTAALSPRTRLLAITGASNLLGTRPDLSAVAEEVHRHGALFFVDGVHLAAHAPVDVRDLGADFFACSPYKFFGPHCGVLVADPDLLEGLHPDKLVPSSDGVPERFELGTLPYELLAGTTAAVEFIADLGELAGVEPSAAPPSASRRERVVRSMRAAEDHEDALRRRIEDALVELPGVTVHSRARRRTPTLLLTFTDRTVADAYRFLADQGVNAPAGTFYAFEPARRLGLPEGGLRIGLAPYNDDSDVDRLLDGLNRFLAT